MYIVKKKIKNKDYFYLRKSEREGEKVKSINVAYLGKSLEEAKRKMKEIVNKEEETEKTDGKIKKILFICKGNKFRSKIAEAFFNKYNKDKLIEVKTAGTNPVTEPFRKDTLNKIKEKFGIKLNLEFTKLDDKLINWADLIVNVADNVELNIPNKKIIKWNIPDTKEDNLEEGVRIIKSIEDKVKDFIRKMEKGEQKQEKPIVKREIKPLTIDELATFCKRKGFVFPSSEIYGGFSGFWDFGPLGVNLFNNIKNSWWKFFVDDKKNMVGIDASIISHPKIWKASGHVASFSDVAVICKKCKKATKIDKSEISKSKDFDDSQKSLISEIGKVKCDCGGEYEKQGEFNLMFKTKVGALNAEDSYLRPETAQGMFTDFKLIAETSRVKLPFGIAQIGKCFRNEIAPRDFLFRDREFTIGEFEFFIHPEKDKCELLDKKHLNLELNLLDAQSQLAKKEELKKTTIGKMLNQKKLGEWHAYWLAEQLLWFKKLGLSMNNIKVREHTKEELSHYSSATFDIDYLYPFGSLEVAGNANRGQYDLNQHIKESGKNMEIYDEETKKKVIPKVIEPTFGIDRVFLAVLTQGYNYDSERENIVLKINPKLAPIKAAIFPIVKDGKMVKIAREIFSELKKDFNVVYDEGGSIGRRYSRNDEIGTPYCITIDDESIKNKTITIRDRDTTQQIRIKIENLKEILSKLLFNEIEFEKTGKKISTRKK